eukprot:scaffold296054_cov24-Tisochrysis_lutea.AAC.1
MGHRSDSISKGVHTKCNGEAEPMSHGWHLFAAGEQIRLHGMGQYPDARSRGAYTAMQPAHCESSKCDLENLRGMCGWQGCTATSVQSNISQADADSSPG